MPDVCRSMKATLFQVWTNSWDADTLELQGRTRLRLVWDIILLCFLPLPVLLPSLILVSPGPLSHESLSWHQPLGVPIYGTFQIWKVNIDFILLIKYLPITFLPVPSFLCLQHFWPPRKLSSHECWKIIETECPWEGIVRQNVSLTSGLRETFQAWWTLSPLIPKSLEGLRFC